ncbi:DEAD/DEAH box helicase [Bacillus sp. CGMCC 1.16541]|uniref:DEAD/DEAH box helicase n=1 Tax=Bacillus sp. CGMCC 1.16541 TaxID=2185143 RepID=UPI000D72DACB|nr:DEAD/DEAH box helicase [Bacillus sp. CGMCC 1.16541]
MRHLFKTKDEIKNYFSPIAYERGFVYYRRGRVRDIEYDFKHHTWFATVLGSEPYEVSIELEGDSFVSECTCLAFEQFRECKHEVAALLEIYDRETMNHSTSTYKNESKTQAVTHFINLFTGYQQNIIEARHTHDKTPLKVEFICKSYSSSFMRSHGNFLVMEIKVGAERTYVVKNMKEFLRKVRDKHPHEFTKKFTYDPAEHYFVKEDQEVIDMLQELVKTESFYRTSSLNSWNDVKVNERELMIPSVITKTLLLKANERLFTFSDEGEEYERIHFSQGELPFSFRFDKSAGSEFELNLSELHDVSFFDRYGLLFYKGVFYELSNEQKLLLEGLRKSAPIAHVLPISEEQMSGFLSHVLPGLKKVGKVTLSEEVSNQMMQPPLKVKLFVDDEYGQLLARLEYHYDDIIIHPFGTTNDEKYEKILIRDTEKEQEVMSLIESAPIKIRQNQLYVEENEESIYEFLFHIVPKLQQLADVYITDSVQMYDLDQQSTPITSIDVQSNGRLLDISFDLHDIDQENIHNILQSVVEKKHYHRLSNGAFVSLEGEEFRNIQKLLSELHVSPADLMNNSMQVPLYRGAQIEEIMGRKTKVSKAFKQLLQHLKHPEELDFDLPSTLQASLRDYQQTGFQWFKGLSHYSLGGILADDMGLGKTLQSIAYILSEKKEHAPNQPFLVVSPASLLYNWKSELERFAPELRVQLVVGTPKEREELLTSQPLPDVLITSYPTLRQDIDLYQSLTFHSMILDEAQMIKNHATKTSEAVRLIQSEKTFALSGTPIENSLDELWAIFQTVLPGLLPHQKAFKGYSNEQISRMVKPFILRRVKKEVLKELPDKIETNHLSELTKTQKELYVAYLEKVKTSLVSGDFNRNRMKILAGLTRLRQICCHPSLFVEGYEGESSKLEQLMDITENAVANGKRLLIFSQFTSMLHIIRNHLTQKGLSFFYLDGQTPSQQRVEMANRFNEGEHDIFLISLKAGGTGLNLTGADTVILYDLWWNPAIEEQAAGRAHRMGQKNVVQVIKLIAQGTIEERIYELQQKKKELIEQVIQPGETMLTSLSEQDIKYLLNV